VHSVQVLTGPFSELSAALRIDGLLKRTRILLFGAPFASDWHRSHIVLTSVCANQRVPRY
jgi:hypothetical protein